jgi:hypothetical protein
MSVNGHEKFTTAWNRTGVALSNSGPQRRWLMISGKQIRALARTCVAILIGVTLGACSADTHPVPATQISDSATRAADAVDSGTVVAEIVVTAPRLRSPQVAEQTSPRPPAKWGS